MYACTYAYIYIYIHYYFQSPRPHFSPYDHFVFILRISKNAGSAKIEFARFQISSAPGYGSFNFSAR